MSDVDGPALDPAQVSVWEALKRRDAILQAVSYAAERFLGSEPLESVLTDVLERLGKAAEASGATVLEFDDDPEQGAKLVPRYSWTAAGAESVFEYASEGFAYAGSDFEHLYAHLEAGNPVVGLIEDIPPGLRALLPSEIRTLAVLPIFTARQLVGAVAMSHRGRQREWAESELNALKTAATVIGAALERNRSRRAVRRRDELLRLIIDNAPLMVAYYDTDMRCRFANRRYADFFGYPERSIIGRFLEEVIGTEGYRVAHPHWKRAYAGEQVVFEREHHGENGSVQHLEVRAVPHHIDSGKLVGCYAILTDITERKRSEEALQRVAAENASILENTVSGIAFLKDRHIVRCNRSFAELFGYEPEELVGASTRLLHLSDELYRRHGEYVYPRVERIGHATGMLQHRRKDGSTIWVHYSTTALDHTDISKGVAWIVHDITEQKTIEEALIQAHDQLEEKVRKRTEELAMANRELEAYSYSVSHDLRAPLRAIDGFTHLLTEKMAGQLDAESAEHLGRVRTAVQRMSGLIDDLLELGRVSRKEIERQEVDLTRHAREIIDELSAQNDSRRLECRIEDGIRAVGDPQLLRTMLQNLLENAWKYTAKTDTGRIEFAASVEADGRLTYRVRDNGAGFDMAYADKLFKPFQRLHNPREFEGSGIGLATVARIVHRHGGEVRAEGRVNQGATFWFTLPN